MIDINFLKANPDAVKENIRKKFQDGKLHLVDEVIELDDRRKEIIRTVEALKAKRNKLSGENGKLFGAVTSEAISKALKEQFDMDIEKNKIVQAEPIKSFGSYTVKAKLGYEVSGNINVLVLEG